MDDEQEGGNTTNDITSDIINDKSNDTTNNDNNNSNNIDIDKTRNIDNDDEDYKDDDDEDDKDNEDDDDDDNEDDDDDNNDNDNENDDNDENDENDENDDNNDDIDIDDNNDIDIEELSDIDPDNLSLSEFENNSNNLYYIKCKDMPVSLCLMEKLDYTLDDILDDGYNMCEQEWFSVFFQVAFGLAVAQKYFLFVHNDLHSSNVMFKETNIKYMYFQINNTYFKIPTYKKITKIIDFARGTFLLGGKWIFSDQFKDDGDACGQYNYPNNPNNDTLDDCENKPNPSFDLVRLGTTVIHHVDNIYNVKTFIENLTKDDYDNSLCYDEDTFQLYIDIAHNCHNAIPFEVLKQEQFTRFIINKTKIPKNAHIYKF